MRQAQGQDVIPKPLGGQTFGGLFWGRVHLKIAGGAHHELPTADVAAHESDAGGLQLVDGARHVRDGRLRVAVRPQQQRRGRHIEVHRGQHNDFCIFFLFLIYYRFLGRNQHFLRQFSIMVKSPGFWTYFWDALEGFFSAEIQVKKNQKLEPPPQK